MRRVLRWLLAAVALLVVGALVAVALGSWRFGRMVDRETAALLAEASAGSDRVITESMLAPLPDPVRRYLTYAGVVGKPIPRSIHLEQTGRMRAKPGDAWTPLNADVTYTVDPSGFVWSGTMHRGPLPIARARDMYRGGNGGMLVKAGGLITVVDARWEAMDRAAMMRFLNEIMWFPTAYLSDKISFEPIDANTARVTFTDHGRDVSGTLRVDDVGRLIVFEAQQYRTVDGRMELEDWSTRVTGYGELGGLRLPVSGRAVWGLRDGDFAYLELTVSAARYDDAH